MVLAGAVTFSVTNSFLPEPMNRIASDLSLLVKGDLKKAEDIRKAEIIVKEKTAATNVKEEQSKIADEKPSLPHTKKIDEAIKRESTAAKDITPNQTTATPKASARHREESPAIEKSTNNPKPAPKTSMAIPKAPVESKPTVAKSPSKAKQPVEPAKPAINTKGTASINPSEVKKTTNETPSLKNRGQEVSQSAKEKAAGNREQKENNRK
jgi:hypothetical protein